MKKIYIKPSINTVAFDNENALMAGSGEKELGYDNSTKIENDYMVGAKNNRYDIWGLDDDE